ncbi:adenosine/AMP deaminase domain-containing protein [Ditylenchus destructor]|uniref:Adenosine/AMP deaminase domain-containing protein n=1 Tax=Ditylenchus destructor TaxID=166010 RepID=A0AAD4NCT9_9BILA|nr:adenosine/AMP deaminase domain-containing protein [Ditylenchus destructor]
MSEARRQLLLSGRSPAEEAIFRDHIFRVYYGWLALPVSVIALFFNFVFITATLRAIRGHRVSRKFYVLMLNRAFGDVLTCLVALTTFVYVILVPRVSQNVIQLMNTFFAGSFWSAMVTYVAAGVLKLYGVAKPLHYHNRVTMRTCIHIIWFSWSVFLLLTILTMCATAFVKIAPLAAWSGCNMEKCLTPVYRFRNALTALVYLLTITCFVLTVILIRRASHKAKILRNGLSDAHNSKSQISFVSLDDNRQDPPREQRLNKRHPQNNHFALIKLTLGVSSLALFHLPYTIWAIILSFAPACYLTFHWTTMQSLMGLVRASLILRIIVDVPISFILDIQEKKTMAARKNPNNGFFAGAPPSVNFFTSIDDEISDPIAPDQDAADQELLARETENKLRLNKKKDLKQDRPEYNEEQNATLGSADSEIFDSGPFQSASIGGTSGHVVSSPFEISHYPIEIQENRKAMQRQISSRKKKEKVPEPSSNDRGRRWSLQPRMESSRGDQLNQFTSGANTPSTERNSQCVSPMSPSRSMTSGALQVDSGPKLMDALDAMKEQKESQRIEMHTFRDAIDVNYQRMALTEEELSGVPLEDLKAASKFLIEGVRLRQEYMEMIGCHFPSTTKHFLHGHYPDNLPKCRKKNTEVSAHTSFHPPEPPSDHWGTSQPLPIYEKKYKLKRHRGTVAILDDRGEIVPELKKYYITKEKYLKDYERLIIMTANGPLKSFSYRRLAFLQTKFQLHVLLNDIRELHEQKSVPHRDFYNIRKVDTHIHAASSMNQKHLLRFIKKKMKTEADVVVHEQNGKKITMRQLFESLGLGAYDLSVDMLDVHADRNTFHRFDKFNTKYNPVGQSVLRDVFIKTDNYVGGKYFAEVLKEVFSDLEDSKYQQAEPRISIYGRKKDEWDKLAKWAITHDVWSTNIRWIIQVPRLFDVYKSKSMIANFDDFDETEFVLDT